MIARPWFFHPDALAELENAGAWYEERREGIGEDFIASAHEVLERAAQQATPGTRMPGVRRPDVRRLLMTPRYPYALILERDECLSLGYRLPAR